MPSKKRIAVLPGDGVGPEIMEHSIKLLEALQEPFDLSFDFKECLIGNVARQKTGSAIPDETLAECARADAILLGAVGSRENKEQGAADLRPQTVLRQLRTAQDAYCNLRSFQSANVRPAKAGTQDTAVRHIDFVVIRGMRDGLYIGEEDDQLELQANSMDDELFSEAEVARLARKALQLAKIRKRKMTLVFDKRSEGGLLNWKKILEKEAKKFPQVKLRALSMNECFKLLEDDPFDLDVVLTESGFGNGVNHAARALVASDGVLASACLGDGVSIYQPVHGAGEVSVEKNWNNPIAMMNSVALMLHYSFHRSLAAQNIEEAITAVLARGYQTEDFTDKSGIVIPAEQMASYILEEISHCLQGPLMTA